MTNAEYKALSIREFDRAAKTYESGHAGIYELCKRDYPPILAELERVGFTRLLDCGCGTAPMLSLLTEKYPDRQYTGIDLSPKMLEAARRKQLKNVTLVEGDCENLPFPAERFDAVICSQSFHHYPDPQAFFNSVYRVLTPGGHLILRDMTGPGWLVWLANHVEMPLANLLGHGDVRSYTRSQVRIFCARAGLVPEKVEQQRGFRLHCVARKPT
jgi:ubiquinone/menaquinone biosynthesis C-methylase UbiE